jgi:hypothetical protein
MEEERPMVMILRSASRENGRYTGRRKPEDGPELTTIGKLLFQEPPAVEHLPSQCIDEDDNGDLAVE